jgi:hypothetical protein
MAIPNIVLGALLLVFGRKLFWLFVGIAGFLVGMEIASNLLADQQEWVRWLAAIGAGLIGVLLAVFAGRVAFAIGGFFAGAYIALMIVQHFGIAVNPNVPLVVGGVIGAVIAAALMDTAIIVLSSLMGAGAIAQEIDVTQPVRSLIFVGLVAAGIVIQFTLMKSSTDYHQRRGSGSRPE